RNLRPDPECKGEDRVIQPTEDVFASEGDTVTLGCTFETTNPYPNLFWYRQEMGDFPKYMLRLTAKPPHPRLTVKLNKERNHLDLQISSAALTDSAVYYCALKPTLTVSPVTV
uniref:Ig-like domain-containing protein n=1 Tax=Labrus bergylta TaxID=56723 RepID=A0A3Q3M0Q9_9LABR